MGKRKQTAPKYADQVKRQQLQWNMSDQMSSSGSQSFICDESLQNEDVNQSEGAPETEPSFASQTKSNNVNSQTPLHALCVDTFYQNLASCHSALTLRKWNHPEMKDKGRLLKFGQFKVTLLPRPLLTPLPDQLPEFETCWLYLGQDDESSMLYFETEASNEHIAQQKKSKSRQSKFGVFWFVYLSVPVTVLSNLKHKSFLLQCDSFDTNHKKFEVTVYGTEGIVLKLSHPSECLRIKAPQVAVQRLMEYFYNHSLPFKFEGVERTTGHDFFHLYESVMAIHHQRLLRDDRWQQEVDGIHHSCLKPVLRHYQRESVAWMLRQEKTQKVTENELHPLYCGAKLQDGTALYYNKYGGCLVKERPRALPNLPGGILADEMGLGKTVEVLCCMLLHPRPDISMPEELPVLDDSLSDSDENTRASNTSTADDPLALKQNGGQESVGKTSDSESCTKAGLGGQQQRDVFEHNSTSDEPGAATINTYELTGRPPNDPPSLAVTQVSGVVSKDDSLLLNQTRDSSASADCQDSQNFIAAGKSVRERLEVADGKHDNTTVVLSNLMAKGEHYVIEVDGVRQRGSIGSLCNGSNTRVISVKSFNPSPAQHAAPIHPEPHLHSSLPLGSDELSTSDSSLKGKRKRKGYEYIPVSDEEPGYFSTKPSAQKQFFECNCGQLDSEAETVKRGLHTVKCNQCGMSQHAECMNYDLKDPYRGEYLCPHCHALHTTIKSGATLIISPYSICHQWLEEINKHIKERSIKVYIYTGVARLGYIQPQTLAQQDIVITTYDVLRKELDYVNLPHTNSESGRRFRHPKRFLATPSPMVAVEWWRICLDEAQMVECVSTKTAEMALKLKAVNRWCVTGTPLMRSVEDIFGLLLFLGVDPFMVQQWFRLLLWEPFCHGFPEPMHQALSQVLWRTAKKDVIDQINLPCQTEEIHWLTFSPMEEHFYRRQYEIYLRNAYSYRHRAPHIQDPNTKLHALDRKTMSELLSPLFRLRQACCHPQIVRGEFVPLNKSMLTMEELLDSMTKKVKTECEEAHRQIVASLNGMAGLCIIRGKLAEAVEKYRDVLRSVDEHQDQFRTDDLQQLHAMYNLAQILDKKPDGVSPTVRDSSLKQQFGALKEKYMSKSKVNVTSSREALEMIRRTIEDLNTKVAALDGDWWADVVDMTVQRGIDHELVCKVKDDLARTSTTEATFADSFTTASGLMYVIDSHLQTLSKARQNLTSGIEKLARDTSASLVEKAAACCLRPVEEILKTCSFCKVDELFNEYESRLFLFVERGITVSGEDSNLAYLVSTKRQGTWADSEVERALKSIQSFYRLHFDADHDIIEASNIQMKYMETLKKEFKSMRSLWLSHREMISAIDECEMATERLRLRTSLDSEAATKIPNVLEEREMMQHELKCSSDEIIGRDQLKKKRGQLLYLINVAKKNQYGEGCNPDTCPICQLELGVEWSVLMCGHCFCLRCIRTLIDRNLIGGQLLERRLKCPMCRHMTPVREISYVTTKKKEMLNVKGSHSTKIQAVVECLIRIRQQDPTAKSLVFSVWVSVLDILAAALAENKILYKSLHDLNYFQKNLSAFKTEKSIQVLLLPLHSGANGLNLVEANHVLLVEPELNLEEEAQAISRIYRIGQTRKTKIHRFLVRGTIEEKIYHMVKTLRESRSGSEEGGEALELTVGHITSLLQQPGPDDEDGEDDSYDTLGEAESRFARPGEGGDQRGGGNENDVAVGSDDAAVILGEVAVGLGDVAVGSDDVAVGSGDEAVGSGDVAVGSGDVAVGSGDVIVGSGDAAVVGSSISLRQEEGAGTVPDSSPE